MSELLFYTKDLLLIGIIKNPVSYIHNERYDKVGDFELHLPLNSKNIELTQLGNVVYQIGNAEAGFIMSKEYRKDIHDRETITVKGLLASGYLKRRIVYGTEILNTTAEEAMRVLVNNNVIATNDPKRKIPNIILGERNDFTEKVDFQTSYKNLAEDVEKIALLSGLGFRMRFDKKNLKHIFEVYKGVNRT